jgi:hypothetical protein
MVRVCNHNSLTGDQRQTSLNLWLATHAKAERDAARYPRSILIAVEFLANLGVCTFPCVDEIDGRAAGVETATRPCRLPLPLE